MIVTNGGGAALDRVIRKTTCTGETSEQKGKKEPSMEEVMEKHARLREQQVQRPSEVF